MTDSDKCLYVGGPVHGRVFSPAEVSALDDKAGFDEYTAVESLEDAPGVDYWTVHEPLRRGRHFDITDVLADARRKARLPDANRPPIDYTGLDD